VKASGPVLDLEAEIARCRREIEAVEAQLRSGHPDVAGLCQALSDWSAELRILEAQRCTRTGSDY
jgi:hypothetical protein